MAYDVELAERVRELVAGEPGYGEMRMFGGVAFLLGGHIAVGASSQGGLMLRVDPQETADLLEQPGVGPFEMRGRGMPGWVRVDADAVRSDDDLRRWVARGVAGARRLPPKEPGTPAPRTVPRNRRTG
jgi:TfoX/Sxy family transcriptional regulator of competence genes